MKCILRNQQPDFTRVVKLNDEVVGTIHAITKVDEGFALSYAMDEGGKLNPYAYTVARIYRSLIGHGAGWELVDEKGKELKVTIENVNLLPDDIHNALAKAVAEINNVTEEHLGNLNEQSD